MKLKEILKGPAASRDAEQGYTALKFKIYELISAIFVKILMYTPVTANQVTVLSILFPYLGAVLFGFGNFWYYLAGIACLYLGELMDAVDGTLARCKKACSRLQSNFLGNIYHSSSYPVIFLGIGYGVALSTGNMTYLLLGGITALFQESIAFMRFLKNTVLFKNQKKVKGVTDYLDEPDESKLFSASKKSSKSFLIKLSGEPMHHLRPIIIIAVLLSYFLNWQTMELFVAFYAIFTPLKAIGYSYSVYRSFKKIETGNG